MITKTIHLLMLLVVSWTIMVTFHELGHVIGGYLGGANLTKLDIAPWRLPYSLHAPDPNPLLTLWAGPILGVGLPILAASIVRSDVVWFVADFCLLANGCYLTLGWWSGDQFLDTTRLLSEGAGVGPVGVYCVLCTGLGYVRFRKDCIAVLRPVSNRKDADGR